MVVSTLFEQKDYKKEVLVLGMDYPPSVNTYWRSVGGRVVLSAKGRAYKEEVRRQLSASGLKHMPAYGAHPVGLALHVLPPDRRRRDLDNTLKALMDALQTVLYEDDYQVSGLLVRRHEPCEGGFVYVMAMVIEAFDAMLDKAKLEGIALEGPPCIFQ